MSEDSSSAHEVYQQRIPDLSDQQKTSSMRAIEILIEALQNKSNSSLNHQQQLTQSIIEKITEGRKDFIECAAKSNPEILMSIKNALQSEISSSTVEGMKNTQSDFQGKLQERSAGFSSPGNSVGHRESQLPML